MTESDQQRAERIAKKYEMVDMNRVPWPDDIAALVEAQREVRRETLEQCADIAQEAGVAEFDETVLGVAKAIRALLAEEEKVELCQKKS